MTAQKIVDAVARQYQIPGPWFSRQFGSRDPKRVRARHVAMWLVRELLSLSYPEIGRIFSRHHTSAIHACSRVSEDDGMLAEALSLKALLSSQMDGSSDLYPSGTDLYKQIVSAKIGDLEGRIASLSKELSEFRDVVSKQRDGEGSNGV